jgi:hypothetical protein
MMNRQSLIQKLKEDIAQGRVVIIAGTGVSIAARGNQLIENHPVASWPGLLQNGLEYCRSLGVADKEDAELLGNQIKSNKTKFLISAAEDISERLQSRSGGHLSPLAQRHRRQACAEASRNPRRAHRTARSAGNFELRRVDRADVQPETGDLTA